MVKRLHETGLIKENERINLELVTDISLKHDRQKYGLISYEPDKKIVFDNLVELAVRAYETDHISYERLEYLLELAGLSPSDLGINEERNYTPDLDIDWDEKVDEIMEKED